MLKEPRSIAGEYGLLTAMLLLSGLLHLVLFYVPAEKGQPQAQRGSGNIVVSITEAMPSAEPSPAAASQQDRAAESVVPMEAEVMEQAADAAAATPDSEMISELIDDMVLPEMATVGPETGNIFTEKGSRPLVQKQTEMSTPAAGVIQKIEPDQSPRKFPQREVVKAEPNGQQAEATIGETQQAGEPAAARPGDSAEIDSYWQELLQQIEHNKRYPYRARKRRNQGQAIVSFFLEKNWEAYKGLPWCKGQATKFLIRRPWLPLKKLLPLPRRRHSCCRPLNRWKL